MREKIAIFYSLFSEELGILRRVPYFQEFNYFERLGYLRQIHEGKDCYFLEFTYHS